MTRVQTAYGPVVGKRHKNILAFLGVRYGASTEGAGRFGAPRNPEPWTDLASCSEYGEVAPQVVRPSSADPFYSWYFHANSPMGEDCLNLNIYTPGADGEARPVMVWFHGGGWMESSANAAGFDGSALANTEDVVVVTVNHRLGAMGFLCLNDDAAPDAGNAGLLDMVLSLKWVRDNIKAFGGSPANVTIFGESGGAGKVAALCSMPVACGLFHKAIIQSVVGGVSLASLDKAQEIAQDLVKALPGKCDLRTLRALPFQDVLRAARSNALLFRGTVDGRYLFDHPFVNDAAHKASFDVPTMFGYTSMEASFFFAREQEIFSIDLDEVIHRVSNYLRVPKDQARSIVRVFQDWLPDQNPGSILIQIASAYMVERNTLKLAERRYRCFDQHVYVYRFDHPSAADGGRLGAPHTSELPYIFGTLDAAQAAIGRSEGHVAMSRIMMRTWAAFARCADPNIEHLPHWPVYDPERPMAMNLAVTSKLLLLSDTPVLSAFEGIPYIESGRSRAALLRH